MLTLIKPVTILFYKTPKLLQLLLADMTCAEFSNMDSQIWIFTPRDSNNNVCEHMWMWIKSTLLHSSCLMWLQQNILFDYWELHCFLQCSMLFLRFIIMRGISMYRKTCLALLYKSDLWRWHFAKTYIWGHTNESISLFHSYLRIQNIYV